MQEPEYSACTSQRRIRTPSLPKLSEFSLFGQIRQVVDVSEGVHADPDDVVEDTVFHPQRICLHISIVDHHQVCQMAEDTTTKVFRLSSATSASNDSQREDEAHNKVPMSQKGQAEGNCVPRQHQCSYHTQPDMCDVRATIDDIEDTEWL